MKIPKPTQTHEIGFWISMPFIAAAYAYIFYGEGLWQRWQTFPVTLLILCTLAYPSWRAHEVYDYYLRKRWPSLEQTSKRVIYKVGVNIFIMTPSVLIVIYCFHYFHVLGYSVKPGDIFYGYLNGLSVNLVFETLWEVIYILAKYQEAADEEEWLKKMQIQQEFENLKQKIKPHFLFNCFNTLLSLIPEDKEKAEFFLNDLSKVYRYLLRNKENGVSTLEEEGKFIQSYSELLKTRFGSGFDLTIALDEDVRNYRIPTLSLQLLIENALKHNIVSKQEPVHILISNEGTSSIVVENTLNLKKKKVDSTGIGLWNIRENYKLLTERRPIIKQTNNKYIVSLPLLLPA